MFEYDTLRVIWWAILGVLLIGFAILDGFDIGAQILLPYAGKTDKERRMVINTVGPIWEGNQVWFILGGGAIFAAWPILYAVAFSGFYFAMLIVLLAFIMRPVAFKFRSKLPATWWRNSWDWVLSISGTITAVVLGVAMGNVLQGVPFHLDPSMRSFYLGSFWGLLNPFALLCGLVSLSMMMMQGGLYLSAKTIESIQNRCIRIARISGLFSILFFAIGGLWLLSGPFGYTITSTRLLNDVSNPLHKTVIKEAGAWFHNYYLYPWTLAAPITGFVGALGAIMLARVANSKLAFVLSSLSIAGIIATVGVSTFPFLLPSSSDPNSSLLVWDASSSQYTLGLMLFCVCTLLPVVLIYTSWVYYILKGRISEVFFAHHEEDMY